MSKILTNLVAAKEETSSLLLAALAMQTRQNVEYRAAKPNPTHMALGEAEMYLPHAMALEVVKKYVYCLRTQEESLLRQIQAAERGIFFEVNPPPVQPKGEDLGITAAFHQRIKETTT